MYYLDNICAASQSFSRRFNFTDNGKVDEDLLDNMKKYLKNNENQSYDTSTFLNKVGQK